MREVLQAELADQVRHDQAWPTRAGTLAKAEQLGAQPAAVLASAAGERELASAKSAAEVLTFRIEQHQVSTQAGPPRTPPPTWRAISYPTPLAAARPGRGAQPQDLPCSGLRWSSAARPTPSGRQPAPRRTPPTTSPPRKSTSAARA